MKTLAVLFGGQSTEHEISNLSACFAAENTDKTKYELLMVGITKDGKWFLYTGPLDAVRSHTWQDDDAHLVIWRADAADFRHLVFAGNDNDGIHHVVVVERAKRPAQYRKPAELRQNFVRSAHARARASRDDHRRTARM